MRAPRNIHDVLTEYFGFSSFRQGQEEIINDIIKGHDVIALLPTGGGKSLCYQIPGLAKEGVCIVISPLIALMKDQVQQLKNRGIIAEALVSGMSHRDIDRILDNAVYGDVKFLYLSPERLRSEIVVERIKRMTVSLVAIDEAHCVSQWGYDFRPPYLQISEIRPHLPSTPFVALTASATPRVIEDLKEKLHLRQVKVHKKSFFRKNLSLKVEWTESPEQRVLDTISETDGSSIIYIRSRKQTTHLATRLAAMGVSAVSYHAGLDREDRDSRQSQWMAGDVRVMVATNAFGMGIDKPDVRLVIHLELPDSPEAYYQEAGRAGRDGLPSLALILLTPHSVERLRDRLQNQLPDIEYTRRVYTALANHLQIPIGSGQGTFSGIVLDSFARKYQLDIRKTFQSLLLLERYGMIRLSEGYKPQSTVYINYPSRQLYEFEVQHPRFAPLLRQMLRWYGGITSGPTYIDERALAATVNLPDHSVSKQLKALEGMQVLEYRPATEGQGLEWTLPRVESKYLPIRQKGLKRLIEEAEARAQTMIYYAKHESECRFVMLLHYFGENRKDCGVCDNCINRSAQPSSTLDKDIINFVTKRSVSLEEIEKEFPLEDVKRLRIIVSSLLDEGIIIRSSQGQYSKRTH